MVRGVTPIRILVVDDHALFRKGIVSLLASEPDFAVVGEAASGPEAVERAGTLRPDIVLMDVFMPGGNGPDAAARLKEIAPGTRIVMLTISEEDEHLFEAVKGGAQGYLLKKVEPQLLFDTLRGVMQGEARISRAMAGKILGEFSRIARVPAPPDPRMDLTSREHEVLEFITHGRSNKEIAVALSIAENTVKNHLKNILEKLHLENRVQAATFALRHKLVKTPPTDPS
jgi:two-component system NarL family response regulator